MTIRICWLEKTCTCCNEVKKLNLFKVRKDAPDKRSGMCKLCANAKKAKNKEYYSEWSKNYRDSIKSNPEKHKEYLDREAGYKRNFRKNPTVRIGKRVSEMMRRSLNGAKERAHTWGILDYSAEELKQHLEAQFSKDMNWERFLNGEIHIDHIIPQSSFSFESFEDEEFKQCWHLTNLQPLWAKDNISKSNKQTYLI